MSRRTSCPECGTILRVRDRSFVGRRVHCPECKTGLRITTSENGDDFLARRLTPDELAGKEHPSQATDKSRADKILVTELERRTIASRLLASPLTAAWLLALAISAFVAVLALAPKHRFAPRPAPVTPVTEPTGEVPSADDKSETKDSADSSSEDATGTNVEPPVTKETLVSPDESTEPMPDPSEAPAAITEDEMHESDIKPEATAEAPLPPPPPKIDIAGRLAQKLVSYKQIKPVSRRDLIEAFEEHLGAPILYESDDLGASNLDQTVSFELENTTLGDVIRKVASSAGWDVLVEETGLRLSRK